MTRDWASPSWAVDQEFAESEHKRDSSGKFTSGGAAKPPFAKGAAKATAKVSSVTLKYAKEIAKSPEKFGREYYRPAIRRLDRHGYSELIAKLKQHMAKDMALDSALYNRALATARRLYTADRAPLMAFDHGLVHGALRSQTVRLPLAMDQHSVRTFSPDGHMHVALSNISRAQVSPYWGKEVPNAEQLGLDPERKYMLLRHPDELAKAAQSFNGIPILIEHQPISAADHPQELVVGSTGTDARWEAPFLQNSLHFWAKPAIDAIRTGERKELSCAYHYDPVMNPGTFEGKPYDGIMTNIHGNHLALVEAGRVGPAAIVADAMPIEWRSYRW